MAETPIERYVGRLNAIFRDAPTKHEAHARSREVIAAMARDPEFVTAALERHLSSPGALDAEHYPVVALDVESNPDYELVVNCWIPLPGGETDVSTKAIHHHGEMLLTTATAFGPGYEHWMLTRPEPIDAERQLYSMELVDHGRHGPGEVAFVDAYVAHVPLYPRSLTLTICLWSSRRRRTWRDVLKRVGVLRRNSAVLRGVARRLGLAKQLDLKLVEYFDYYPSNGGFVGMRDREEFPRGPNADYLHSLFHVIQATGNERLAGAVEQRLKRGGPIKNLALVESLLQRLRAGEPIEGRLSDGHYGVAHANFTRAEIERALAGQPPR